jgi:hypothetical protein
MGQKSLATTKALKNYFTGKIVGVSFKHFLEKN